MKKLINNVKLQSIFKSLMVNGNVKDIHLKVGENNIHIGEITVVDNNKDSKVDVSFNKEAGRDLKLSGNHEYKIEVKNFTINGSEGGEFSVETLEFNGLSKVARNVSTQNYLH